MNLGDYGFEDVELAEGEDVVFRIDKTAGDGNPASRRPEALLLTGRRLIHLAGAGKKRQAMMIPLRALDSAEVVSFKGGAGAYVWAGLAAVLSVVLYAVIDNLAGRILAPMAVLGMGAYLAVNHLTDTGQPAAVFRAGESEIRWLFDPREGAADAYALINALHAELSPAADGGADAGEDSARFAAR